MHKGDFDMSLLSANVTERPNCLLSIYRRFILYMVPDIKNNRKINL